MQLSALILAKNESVNMADCLACLAFADEIIVVDDNSADDTAAIAARCGAKVYERAMQGDFAEQQNFAIGKAGGDWLLFVDCDERITPALADEIQLVMQKKPKAYRIRRLNHFAGQRVRFGSLRRDSVCRLLPRLQVKAERRVHQKFQHPYRESTLKSPMLHYTYASWTQYYDKFEHYTRLSAQQYAAQGKRVGFVKDIVLRPLWAWLKMYIIHGGFLDGRLGWLLAVNHYHYTMTKYSRLYSLYHYGEDSL